MSPNFSLLGNSSGATITGGNNLLDIDAKLGTLANNGGQSQTNSLLLDSPAIDAGDDSVLSAPNSLTTDQRGSGFPRKSGTRVDIGAFEVQQPVTISGTIYRDANNDGQSNTGETGLGGAIVEVFGSTNSTIGDSDDRLLGTTTTAADGTYSLANIPFATNYYVKVRVAPGFAFTTQGAGSAVDATGTSALFTAEGGSTTTVNAGVTGFATTSQAFTIGGPNNDISNDVAKDAAGNLYIVGNFRNLVDFDPGVGVSNLTSAGVDDIYVAKYAPSGALVWVRSAGGTGFDQTFGVAVDADGNVYATGQFRDTATFNSGTGSTTLVSAGNADAFIWKLDSAGNTVWVRQASGPAQDFGRNVKVDSTGNVFVSGVFTQTATFNAGTGTASLTSVSSSADIFVWKLDAGGNTVWVRQAGGVQNEAPNGLGLDGNGNLYLTGFFNGTATFNAGSGTASLTSAGGLDLFVWKLDIDGNTVFARRAGGTDTDFAFGLTSDSAGNSYVTGNFRETATFEGGNGSSSLTAISAGDIFVWKLDATGNTGWLRQAVGSPSGSNAGLGIALTPTGNVLVTGSFVNSVAFPTAGGTTTLTASDDSSGDVFVWSLDNAGNGLWVRQLASNNFAEGLGITSDTDGSAIVVGDFEGTVDFDPSIKNNPLTAPSTDGFLVRVSAPRTIQGIVFQDTNGDGNVQANEPILAGVGVELFGSTDQTAGNGDDVPLLSAVTAADGSYRFDVPTSPFYFTKFRLPPGFTFTGFPTQEGPGNSADPTGTSFIFSFASQQSELTVNAGVTGTPAMAQGMPPVQLGGPGSDETIGLAKDSAGNTYVSGIFEGTIDFDPGVGVSNLTSPNSRSSYLAKYAPSGALISVQVLTNARVETLVVDANDNLIAGGFFVGTTTFGPGFILTATGSSAFIWKLDSVGNTQFVKAVTGTSTSATKEVATDANGNVYLTGSYSGTAMFGPSSLTSSGGTDLFVWKLSATGNSVWVRSTGGTSGKISTSLAIDPTTGAVVAGGSFDNTATFNAGTGTASLTSAGQRDAFIWKLDSDGNTLFARQAGGVNSDQTEALGIDATGNIYASGGFFGTATFNAGTGEGSLTAGGTSENGFVWKLDSAGNTVFVRQPQTAGASYSFALAVDAMGNTISSGYFDGATTFSGGPASTTLQPQGQFELYVWRIDAAGNSQYVQRIGGSGSTFTQPYNLVTDAAGNATLSLYFFGSIDTDSSGGVSNVTSAGGSDGLLLQVPAIQNPANGTFTVGNLSDVDDGDYSPGNLSFREALNLASQLPGPSIIAIPDSLAGQTITLTGAPLQLTATGADNATTITGPAGGITFSGNNQSQVFLINSGVFVNLSNLTVTGGNGRGGIGASGGGINNNGTLTLTNVTVSGNGTTDSDSSVGGGIFNFGTLTLTNSTVTDNESDGNGGGIYNAGTVTLNNSTITNNRTLFQTSGPGAGYFHDGQGGGTSTLTNTIVFGNFRGTTADDVAGAVTGNNSLFGATTGATITGANNLLNVDPLLAPLGNYGGPVQTFALLPGSPAIDAGTGTGSDVRGLPSVGNRDIGVFESQGFNLNIIGGNNQAALVNSPFQNPLQVRVSANNSVEPVVGGLVTFTSPASGPSAQNNGLKRFASFIQADSIAETFLGSNGLAGSYQVVASAEGATSVNFDLINGTTPVLTLPTIPLLEAGKPFNVTFPAVGNPAATYQLAGTLPSPDYSFRLKRRSLIGRLKGYTTSP